MSSLQDEPSGNFHIVICYDGNRFKRSMDTKSKVKAAARAEEVDEIRSFIKRGRLAFPEGGRVVRRTLKRLLDLFSQGPISIARQVTGSQVQNHFNMTLKGSRWAYIKGWHCLRNGFISNLAYDGIG